MKTAFLVGALFGVVFIGCSLLYMRSRTVDALGDFLDRLSPWILGGAIVGAAGWASSLGVALAFWLAQ